MKRYIGEIFWIKLDKETGTTTSESFAKIKRAILKDNIFSIDHKNPADLPDSEIKLRSKDGFKFEGSAKYVNSPRYSAIINLECYPNKQETILKGLWKEDQIEFVCVIILKEVQSFQD